jgi:hypothetical protein
MKLYAIKKTFRGGQDVYYISLNDAEEVTEEMLKRIGEYTPGGENYGYEVTAKKIRKLPKGAALLSRRRTVTVY